MAHPYLPLAHRLVDAAGAAILPHFRGGFVVDDKVGQATDIDPVTVADREAEEAIRAVLAAEVPDHAVLGEEHGRLETGSPYEWVIDPIDGTRGFVAGFPTWGTIVGLRHEGRPVLGVVDQPWTGERWWADEDGGWFRARGQERRLRARPCARLADAVFSTTSPETFRGAEVEVLRAFQARTRLRRFGGDCYAYCLLAMGQIDVIVESGLQPYDVMGLLPILRAAGAVATAWDGGPPIHDGTLVTAGDPAVHAEALAVIRSALA